MIGLIILGWIGSCLLSLYIAREDFGYIPLNWLIMSIFAAPFAAFVALVMAGNSIELFRKK